MTEFAPAVRTNTAIVLALAGASGSGKTKSALELAVGLAGERGRILMIDSEGRRGLHYAPRAGEKPDYIDTYPFHHHEWRPPYTPEALGKLLNEGADDGFAVIIVDSMSDEHEGEGGLCDMKDEEVAEQRRKNWEVNDAAAWGRPKAQHKKHIVRWLRRNRCHVIFCLRADEKVRFEKEWKNGKQRTVVVPIGWTPVAEKRLLYEVGSSMLFVPWTDPKEPDPRGKPIPIKIYSHHAPFFPPDRVVTQEAGKSLAEWAAGGTPSISPGREPAIPAGPPPPLGEADIDALRDDLNDTAESKAGEGTAEFRDWWKVLPTYERNLIRGMLRRYEGMAREADDVGRG